MDSPHNYFTLAASVSAQYPTNAVGGATTTAASAWKGPAGLAVGQYKAVLRSVVITNRDTAAGTIIIADHAGTTLTTIRVGAATANTIPDAAFVEFGPSGIQIPGDGIRATPSSTNIIATIIFDAR